MRDKNGLYEIEGHIEVLQTLKSSLLELQSANSIMGNVYLLNRGQLSEIFQFNVVFRTV